MIEFQGIKYSFTLCNKLSSVGRYFCPILNLFPSHKEEKILIKNSNKLVILSEVSITTRFTNLIL